VLLRALAADPSLTRRTRSFSHSKPFVISKSSGYTYALFAAFCRELLLSASHPVCHPSGRSPGIGSAMNIKEIKELIEAVSQNGITDLEVQRSGVKVRIRKEGQPVVVNAASSNPTYAFPTGYTPSTLSGEGALTVRTPAAPPAREEENLFIVRSPIVGTFYRAPNPEAESFVKVGDTIEHGRVLCIIEAMKLMNEIEAEVSGEVVKIYVENGEPVEFGQALFGIRPTEKG
jgi:acetyl-CoA carboxylase biotin carboxyl carrier protein